jgi:Cys-tRNA(Pro)/Cys-tRNA(Cys) deacylase
MDLEAYLKATGIWHRFLKKPETVHTEDASHVTGIALKRITKNLVCKTSDGCYVLLIIQGDRRVSLRKAAQVLNTRNVQLLSSAEAETVTGYPPGGTPSVHHKTQMTVIIDSNLLGYESVFCGGGSRDKLLELKIEDVIRLNSAIVADISEE